MPLTQLQRHQMNTSKQTAQAVPCYRYHVQACASLDAMTQLLSRIHWFQVN